MRRKEEEAFMRRQTEREREQKNLKGVLRIIYSE